MNCRGAEGGIWSQLLWCKSFSIEVLWSRKRNPGRIQFNKYKFSDETYCKPLSDCNAFKLESQSDCLYAERKFGSFFLHLWLYGAWKTVLPWRNLNFVWRKHENEDVVTENVLKLDRGRFWIKHSKKSKPKTGTICHLQVSITVFCECSFLGACLFLTAQGMYSRKIYPAAMLGLSSTWIFGTM